MARKQRSGGMLVAILRGSLVLQIVIGLVAGLLLALVSPSAAKSVGLLGDLFIGALKAVAPVLVFVLVMAAIAGHREGQQTHMGSILMLYLIGTFAGALVAVLASFMFPVTLTLKPATEALTPPGNIAEVLRNLLVSMVNNPVAAILNANYIGILAWGVALGLALRRAHDTTKQMLANFGDALVKLVYAVIRTAPIGLFGLMAATIASTGLGALLEYARLIALLVGSMLFVALVVNPLIVFLKIRRNPYPLVFTCLRESGITAFFTRSSAANIPVNLALCVKVGPPNETYTLTLRAALPI